MKIDEILAALRDEREQLDEAILSLERIGHGQAQFKRIDHGQAQFKKLGRPPGSKNKPKLLPLAV
jgi:hypothetical protein